LNVVDACGWLEYLADGPNAEFFADAVEATEDLVVPTISMYEVFKRVLQQRGEGAALRAIAVMQQGRVAELDSSSALAAARISLDLKLPMADSIMLAATRAYEALLWTEDADFANLAEVRYIARR
jgi:toxin FitB